MKILVLNGINLNMFGKREPGVYGTSTLAEIDAQLQALAGELGVTVESFQTNHEAEICERIHRAVFRTCSWWVTCAGWSSKREQATCRRPG